MAGTATQLCLQAGHQGCVCKALICYNPRARALVCSSHGPLTRVSGHLFALKPATKMPGLAAQMSPRHAPLHGASQRPGDGACAT